MKRSRILFLAAALAVSAGTYCKDMATKAITTQSTLDQSLTDAPFSVLKFTAPWCGACKSPIFNELADTNKDIEFLVSCYFSLLVLHPKNLCIEKVFSLE